MWLQDIDAFEDAWDQLKKPENSNSPGKRNDRVANGSHQKPSQKLATKQRKQRQQIRHKQSSEESSSEQELELISES